MTCSFRPNALSGLSGKPSIFIDFHQKSSILRVVLGHLIEMSMPDDVFEIFTRKSFLYALENNLCWEGATRNLASSDFKNQPKKNEQIVFIGLSWKPSISIDFHQKSSILCVVLGHLVEMSISYGVFVIFTRKSFLYALQIMSRTRSPKIGHIWFQKPAEKNCTNGFFSDQGISMWRHFTAWIPLNPSTISIENPRFSILSLHSDKKFWSQK
jgi:hypothetical protein